VQSGLHNRLDLFGGQDEGTQAVKRIFRQSLRPLLLKPLAPLHDAGLRDWAMTLWGKPSVR